MLLNLNNTCFLLRDCLTTIKTNKIAKGLCAKGFQEDAKHDHRIFRLYVENKKTGIYTKISHGKSEYGDQLISLMARELYMENSRYFLNYIHCDISYKQYIETLKEKKILSEK